MMKLGEALQERAAAQRKMAELRVRLAANVTGNEDEAAVEDPIALLAEADAVADRLGELIRRINATNSATAFSGGGTLTDALARRDVLSTKLGTLDQAAKAAMPVTGWRAGRSELRSVVRVDIPALRRRIEELSAERRQLDAALQRLSWETDVAG